MKQVLLFIAMVGVIQMSQAASRGVITPDRESASAAVILQADGTLKEPTIPSNIIAEPEVTKPDVTIMEGKPEGMDAPIQQEFIVK